MTELYDVLNKARKQKWSNEQFTEAYTSFEGKTIAGWITFQSRPLFRATTTEIPRTFKLNRERSGNAPHVWRSRSEATPLDFDETNDIATPIQLWEGIRSGVRLFIIKSGKAPSPERNDLYRIEGKCTAKPKGNACAYIGEIMLRDKTNRVHTTRVYLGTMKITLVLCHSTKQGFQKWDE